MLRLGEVRDAASAEDSDENGDEGEDGEDCARVGKTGVANATATPPSASDARRRMARGDEDATAVAANVGGGDGVAASPSHYRIDDDCVVTQ